MYLFLKKNRIYIFTESELNRIIKKEVMLRINKKVWFPVLSSLLFLLIKLWSIESIKITYETHGQILMIIVGTSFLYFEERLPPIELPVKRIKITFGANWRIYDSGSNLKGLRTSFINNQNDTLI